MVLFDVARVPEPGSLIPILIGALLLLAIVIAVVYVIARLTRKRPPQEH